MVVTRENHRQKHLAIFVKIVIELEQNFLRERRNISGCNITVEKVAFYIHAYG